MTCPAIVEVRTPIVLPPVQVSLLGDHVLREVAKPVTSEDITQLVERMIAIKRRYNGLGLAAPQIGVSLRVIVVDLECGRDFVLVNPHLTTKSDMKELGSEGCISIPDFFTQIWRHKQIAVQAYDAACDRVSTMLLKNLDARVVQHEIDHLNGKLIVDGVSRPQRRLAERNVAQARQRLTPPTLHVAR